MNLSTRQLRAFLALADLRSFTRAAEQMHLSQPAFSSLIRSLEDTLAARLFDRDTRKVDLTAAGRRFERAAREVLSHFDDVMGSVCRDLSIVDRVAVAGSPSLCARFLPVVVADYRRKHPAIDIEVVDALPQPCVDLVREGKVDLALSTVDAKDADIHKELLCLDRFYVVCRKDHVLAGKAVVTIEELVQHPFIHFTTTTRLRHQIDAALRPHKPNAVMEVERLEAVRGLVESGVGISLVPSLTLSHFSSSQLAIKPLAAPGIVREVFLLTTAGRTPSAAADALAEPIRKQMQSLLRPGSLELDFEKLAALVPGLKVQESAR
jgi:LysR family carnitine catabolism transcriptional activator